MAILYDSYCMSHTIWVIQVRANENLDVIQWFEVRFRNIFEMYWFWCLAGDSCQFYFLKICISYITYFSESWSFFIKIWWPLRRALNLRALSYFKLFVNEVILYDCGLESYLKSRYKNVANSFHSTQIRISAKLETAKSVKPNTVNPSP